MERSDKLDSGDAISHCCALSTSSSDALISMKKEEEAQDMESNEVLKWKVEVLMNDAEQLKAKRQKIHKVIRDKDHQRNQLLQYRQELSVLSKKMGLQGKELKRESRQNEALKKELESVRKELRSAKQRAVSQRVEHQRLKECLDKAIKERDSLQATVLRCEKERSELRDKLSNQLSSVNKKDGQCKKQTKEILLLKLENQKLERKRSMAGSDAEGWKRELRKCEEELHAQKEKLEESKKCRTLEDIYGKKMLLIPQRSHTSKRPSRQLETLQKEMLARTEELQKAQKLCEELKEKLREVPPRLQLCQATVRDLREKLKAITAERNMYRGQTEQLGVEIADFKKGHRKSRNRAAGRNKISKGSPRDKAR